MGCGSEPEAPHVAAESQRDVSSSGLGGFSGARARDRAAAAQRRRHVRGRYRWGCCSTSSRRRWGSGRREEKPCRCWSSCPRQHPLEGLAERVERVLVKVVPKLGVGVFGVPSTATCTRATRQHWMWQGSGRLGSSNRREPVTWRARVHADDKSITTRLSPVRGTRSPLYNPDRSRFRFRKDRADSYGCAEDSRGRPAGCFYLNEAPERVKWLFNRLRGLNRRPTALGRLPILFLDGIAVGEKSCFWGSRAALLHPGPPHRLQVVV